MSDAPPPETSAFERLRRGASWLAVATFATSFVALLVLSATTYWTPDNELVQRCDQVWRVSGLVALVLALIPQGQRAWAVLQGWFSPGRS